MVELNYPKIQLINDKSDLSQAEFVDWDVEINNTRYDVYRIPDFVHSIGGRWGMNDYWCCPENQKPSFENLMQFNGYPVRWGIQIYESGSIKLKWGDRGLNRSCNYLITRNDKPFYRNNVASLDYAMIVAREKLYKLQEFPVNLVSKNWKKSFINRKIWYKNEPAIIKRWIDGEACMIIYPDNPSKMFSKPIEGMDELFFDEDLKSFNVEIFSPHIWWWRD